MSKGLWCSQISKNEVTNDRDEAIFIMASSSGHRTCGSTRTAQASLPIKIVDRDTDGRQACTARQPRLVTDSKYSL